MFARADIESALEYMQSANLIRLARGGTFTGKWQQLHCPFHNDGQERKPSCGCLPEEETRNGTTYPAGHWHCFSCSANYSFGNGIREILRLKGTSLAAHPFLEKYVNNTVTEDPEEKLINNNLYSSMMSNYRTSEISRITLRPILNMSTNQYNYV